MPHSVFRYSLSYRYWDLFCSGKLIYFQIRFVRSNSRLTLNPFLFSVTGAWAFTVRQSHFQGETIHMLIKGTSTLQSHNGTLHSTFSAFQKIRPHAAQLLILQKLQYSPHFLSYTVGYYVSFANDLSHYYNRIHCPACIQSNDVQFVNKSFDPVH